VTPEDPTAARARFRQVVERAIERDDARHHALLERLRALRDGDVPPAKRPDADRRQRAHERLLAAVGLPRRSDAPTWPTPEPIESTPPALTSCVRCGREVLIDAACACAAAGDRDAGV
jgi:hypothetical protein